MRVKCEKNPTKLNPFIRPIAKGISSMESNTKNLDIAGESLCAVYEAIYQGDVPIRVSISDEILELTGYPAQQFIEQHGLFSSLVLDEDRESFRAAIDECEQGSGRLNWIGRIMRPDGEIRTVRFVSRRKSLECGRHHWNGVVFDVTVRNEQESLLCQHEELFQMFAEWGPGVFYVREAKPPYKIVKTSSNAKKFVQPGELDKVIGAGGGAGVVHPDDVPVVMASLEETVQKGHSTIEIRVGNPESGYRRLLTHKQISTNDPSLMLGIAIDVTEHSRKVREAEERMKAIMATGPVALAVFDQQFGLAYANDKMTAQFGRPLNELLGSGWLSSVHRTDRKRVQSVLKRTETTKKQGACRCQVILGEREKLTFTATFAPLFVDGQFDGVVASLQDVTTFEDSEQFNSALLQKAGAAAHFKGIVAELFVGSLGEIVGRIEAATAHFRSNPLDSRRAEQIESLTAELKHRIALSPLVLNDIDDGIFSPMPISICELVQSTAEAVKHRFEQQAASLETTQVRACSNFINSEQRIARFVIESVFGVMADACQVEGTAIVNCTCKVDKSATLTASVTAKNESIQSFQDLDSTWRLAQKPSPVTVSLLVARRLAESLGGGLTIVSQGSMVTIEVKFADLKPTGGQPEPRKVGERARLD